MGNPLFLWPCSIAMLVHQGVCFVFLGCYIHRRCPSGFTPMGFRGLKQGLDWRSIFGVRYLPRPETEESKHPEVSEDEVILSPKKIKWINKKHDKPSNLGHTPFSEAIFGHCYHYLFFKDWCYPRLHQKNAIWMVWEQLRLPPFVFF